MTEQDILHNKNAASLSCFCCEIQIFMTIKILQILIIL